MTYQNKRVLAAHKAVNTLSLNLLSTANLDEVKELCNDIISLQFQIDDDFTHEGIIAREVNKTTMEKLLQIWQQKKRNQSIDTFMD